jgi:hypothetical protein
LLQGGEARAACVIGVASVTLDRGLGAVFPLPRSVVPAGRGYEEHALAHLSAALAASSAPTPGFTLARGMAGIGWLVEHLAGRAAQAASAGRGRSLRGACRKRRYHRAGERSSGLPWHRFRAAPGDEDGPLPASSAPRPPRCSGRPRTETRCRSRSSSRSPGPPMRVSLLPTADAMPAAAAVGEEASRKSMFEASNTLTPA